MRDLEKSWLTCAALSEVRGAPGRWDRAAAAADDVTGMCEPLVSFSSPSETGFSGERDSVQRDTRRFTPRSAKSAMSRRRGMCFHLPPSLPASGPAAGAARCRDYSDGDGKGGRERERRGGGKSSDEWKGSGVMSGRARQLESP